MSDDPSGKNQRRAALAIVVVYGGLMLAVVAVTIWAIVTWSTTTLWVLGGFAVFGAIQPLYCWLRYGGK